jgi:hypothetical protein
MKMKGTAATWLLAGVVALAACGGAAGGPGATVPVGASTAGAAGDGGAGAVPAAGADAGAGPSAGPGTDAGAAPGAAAVTDAGAAAPPGAPVPELKSPVPTALAADLQALGLDPKHLPPIEKLQPKALRAVMKLMAKSLGVKCGDCHKEGDFTAPTRRKKIAAKMWDEFVVKMVLAAPPPDGSPLFCDSCHQGRVEQLDRRDKKALAKWMDANFVGLLKQQKAGSSQECESCHVDMEMQFLTLWGK